MKRTPSRCTYKAIGRLVLASPIPAGKDTAIWFEDTLISLFQTLKGMTKDSAFTPQCLEQKIFNTILLHLGKKALIKFCAASGSPLSSSQMAERLRSAFSNIALKISQYAPSIAPLRSVVRWRTRCRKTCLTQSTRHTKGDITRPFFMTASIENGTALCSRCQQSERLESGYSRCTSNVMVPAGARFSHTRRPRHRNRLL